MGRTQSRALAACSVLAASTLILAGCGSGSSASSSSASSAGASSAAGGTTSSSLSDISGIPAGNETVTPKRSGNSFIYPLGNGKSIKWAKGTKLNIAFFAIGSNNSWLQAQINAVKSQAQKIGATATIFDGKFDAQTQQSQVQAALTGNKYNAFIVNPVDPKLECNLFTVDAPAKNIPVVDITGPLCQRNGNNGSAAWSPGTLNFVGGHDLEGFYQDYFMKVASLNPDASVALLTGPPLNGPGDNSVSAMKATEKKFPNFHVLATYRTDYLPDTGLKDTESFLQAHPNATALISTYSQITDGILGALRKLNKVGKIKVYTIAGNSEDVTNIKSGAVTMSAPLYPVSMGQVAVKSLYRMTQGESIPRYMGNDGHPIESIRGKGDTQLFLTKKNIDKFTPQYK